MPPPCDSFSVDKGTISRWMTASLSLFHLKICEVLRISASHFVFVVGDSNSASYPTLWMDILLRTPSSFVQKNEWEWIWTIPASCIAKVFLRVLPENDKYWNKKLKVCVWNDQY
jgi:hypothetical protein